jgi:tubulin polyglutamylase TTLL1
MYGYDVLIEDNLKPWLIEVNSSPSLSTTTESDRIMKMKIIEEVFKIVVPNDWTDETSKHGAASSKEI